MGNQRGRAQNRKSRARGRRRRIPGPGGIRCRTIPLVHGIGFYRGEVGWGSRSRERSLSWALTAWVVCAAHPWKPERSHGAAGVLASATSHGVRFRARRRRRRPTRLRTTEFTLPDTSHTTHSHLTATLHSSIFVMSGGGGDGGAGSRGGPNQTACVVASSQGIHARSR